MLILLATPLVKHPSFEQLFSLQVNVKEIEERICQQYQFLGRPKDIRRSVLPTVSENENSLRPIAKPLSAQLVRDTIGIAQAQKAQSNSRVANHVIRCKNVWSLS